MPWISQFSGTALSGDFRWDYITSLTPKRLMRDSTSPTQKSYLSFRGNTKYEFKSTKTYIWKTHVLKFNSASASVPLGIPLRSLSISPPYKSATFSYREKGRQNFIGPGSYTPHTLAWTLPRNTDLDNTLIFIDRPTTTIKTENQVNYSATYENFDGSGIVSSKLIEIDWLIQGYCFATSSVASSDIGYEGWIFNENDESYTFKHSTNNALEKRYPISLNLSTLSGILNTNSVASSNSAGTYYTGVTYSNFISRYVDTTSFNLNLGVSIYGSSYIDAYLFNNEPPITSSQSVFDAFLKNGQKIARFNTSGTFSFFNLSGEKYLAFVSEYKNTNIDYSNTIRNIQVIGNYSDTDNNEEFILTNDNQYFDPINLIPLGSSTIATYSIITTTNQTRHENGSVIFGLTGATGSFPGFYTNMAGTIVNLNSLKSKIGNSKFKSGVWENGVWNSGLRLDENTYQFDDIQRSIKLTTQNINWRIQIFGSTFSTSQFEIGDRISISNIVAIDINEERKLLKNYFTIVNKGDNALIVEASNSFPIRRIEKDSENHKILVTKNIWLNGGFLNGKFKGIWNDGLFRGYPYITEMYDTHWVDGTFNGGHFTSNRNYSIFIDTYYWEGNVGLTFGSTAHGLLPGDKIFIDKFDKTINFNYDGQTTVTSVIDDYLVITDKVWEASTSDESGLIYNMSNTGLVQKFKFFDNNVAPKTSNNSNTPREIWKFNSWMDLIYKTQSSTNIGSQKILFNASSNNINEVLETHKFGFGDYTALNLYGYVTDDVLSSESQFRDIDSFFKRNYNLGTKYQIYQDFLGDLSEFNGAFDSDPEIGNLDSFYADGWTYSFSGIRATYSFINKYAKSRSTSINFLSYDRVTSNAGSIYHFPETSYPPVSGAQNPTWFPVPFTSVIEDSFGALITETTPNIEWKISTAGNYEVNVKLNTDFETKAYAPGLAGWPDNDYLFITGGIMLGQLRLLKWDNETNGYVVLTSKTIKTSGGNYNLGTPAFSEGQDTALVNKSFILNIDWKGQLKVNDKIKVEFQKCSTPIVSYNSAGPWRGSGFDSDLGVIAGIHVNPFLLGVSTNDYITETVSEWTIKPGSTINISNSGVDTSLGFHMKRTTNKTFQYESDNEISFFTLNNTNINIEKNRYSMIEFDIINQPDSLLNIFSYGTQSFELQFHTIDLYNFTNFVSDELIYGPTHSFPAGYNPLIQPFSDSLSVYSNGIDYKYIGQTRVKEFFYNRPGLDLGLWNFQTQYTDNSISKVHEIDNVKFYEVDMIPFFQYTTEEFVNKQVQVPFVGVAPYIDYTDENFNFVGAIQIGLDGISIDSNQSVSSVSFFSTSFQQITSNNSVASS